MKNNNIDPHKVTKPIQLLAAWLAGLVLVNGTFLGIASSFEAGSFERLALTIASIVNVPLFLGAIFVLQTKFRPELQEDSYYSSYLDKRTQKVSELVAPSDLRKTIESLKNDIHSLKFVETKHDGVDDTDQADLSDFGISVALATNFSEYRNLKRELLQLGVFEINEFDPEKFGDRPEKMHLTINRGLPFKAKLDLLKLGMKYNFESYSYDTPSPINTEDVYFGGFGYGGEEEESLDFPINAKLKELLGRPLSSNDLLNFELEVEGF